MSVTVGIDGGQSQIRMRVSNEHPVSVAPGVSHLEEDTDAAVVAAVRQLWNGRLERPLRIVAGLTTVPDAPEARLHLAGLIADVTGAGEVWVCGDEVIAHAGALDGTTGVALSVGTGVACLALDGSGRSRRFDGAGYLLGDEGGAFWLGRNGIRRALAADEGRGPATALTTSGRRPPRPARRVGLAYPPTAPAGGHHRPVRPDGARRGGRRRLGG